MSTRQSPACPVAVAFCLAAGVSLLLVSPARSQSCTIDADELGRGETKPFLICGASVTPDFVFDGLHQAGIEVRYEQFLKRCDVHEKRPGIFFVLRASDQARSAELVVRNTDTGNILCENLHIDVSQRVRLADAATPAWSSAMPEAAAKFVDVDGIRTRYFEKGEGAALLLVHGGQPSSADASAWDWQQNFDGLARSFHVYALDKLGQGYTDNPNSLADYDDYYPRVVKHLYGFIEAMGLGRVHLVGHSQGGWPVTRITLDHPDLVASLVLVDSTMVAPAQNVAQAVRFYIYLSEELHPPGGETLESTRRLMEMFTYTKNNITEQRVERSLAISRLPKFKAAQDWFEASGMSPAHPSYRALKKQIWAELEAGELRVPTLIVWGLEDPEGSFPAGLNMFESLSNAGSNVRFHGFGRSGHVPFIEYPEAFNQLITGFVSGVSSPESY